MKLFVATSEFINHERLHKLEYIHKIFSEIAKISTEHTTCVVTINIIDFDLLTAIQKKFEDIPCDIEFRFTSHNLTNFYFLCWEHKDYFQEFLSNSYTHFLYLENDQLVTQQHIDYWVNSRELFLKYNTNFIPGFHRIEYNLQGIPYSVDCLKQIDMKFMPILNFDGRNFFSPDQAYQGMYMMDRILVEEQFTSKFFSYNSSYEWGVPEQANIGNMYDNVPDGFLHRNLLPLDDFSDCWVHHLPNKFVNVPHEKFGKIPMNSLLIG